MFYLHIECQSYEVRHNVSAARLHGDQGHGAVQGFKVVHFVTLQTHVLTQVPVELGTMLWDTDKRNYLSHPLGKWGLKHGC